LTKKELDLQVRLMALENLLTMLIVDKYTRDGFSDATVRSLNKKLIEKARQETFPGADSALSDHVAADTSSRYRGFCVVSKRRWRS
jgi:hypothetical protein